MIPAHTLIHTLDLPVRVHTTLYCYLKELGLEPTYANAVYIPDAELLRQPNFGKGSLQQWFEFRKANPIARSDKRAELLTALLSKLIRETIHEAQLAATMSRPVNESSLDKIKSQIVEEFAR